MNENIPENVEEIRIVLKTKGYYFANGKEDTEIFSKNTIDKKFFYDPHNWTGEFKQIERESWGIKEVKSFYGKLIEDNGKKLKIKPLLNLGSVDYFLLSKKQIKTIKRHIGKN
jgi:hypothetical protein